MSQVSSGRVYATLAVKDITEGKKFYGEALGLSQVDENPGGVTYEAGGGRLFVYEAPTAGTNQATSACWDVENIEEAVAELEAAGIVFEIYDMPQTEWQGPVAVWGPMKSAWFKDPSGNTIMIGSVTKW